MAELVLSELLPEVHDLVNAAVLWMYEEENLTFTLVIANRTDDCISWPATPLYVRYLLTQKWFMRVEGSDRWAFSMTFGRM